MKTKNKLALLAGLGMALAGMSAHAQSEAAHQAPDGPPPGPPHARFGQVLQGVINQYDANQDGQLDSGEMAALRQDVANGKVAPPGAPAGGGPRGFGGPPAHVPKEMLDKYDTNQDGMLDGTERAVLHKDVQDGKALPPGLGRGPRGTLGAPPTAQQILERFDANQDGKLDEAELTAFLTSMPGPGPLHRRGGGPPWDERQPGGDPRQ